MVRLTRVHTVVVVALVAALAIWASPAGAADPPHLDCGKGWEALFCPLRVPGFIVEGRVFLASEFMERGERVAYATLEGINFYGQLVGDFGDRIILTEGLVVDVAEDIVPGVILARSLERAIAHATDSGDLGIGGPTTDIDSLIVRQSPTHAARPALIDYGKAVTEATHK
jgi:hypothetical protein